MYLIVGLGNPGDEHKHSRHNAGFMVADAFAKSKSVRFTSKAGVRKAKCTVDERSILIVKPLSYMNASGEVLPALMMDGGIKPEDTMVIHDDMDLPLGTIRLGFGGGSAGHRGVESVIKVLHTRDFNRLRVGIGRPPEGVDPIDYVLTGFVSEEKQFLPAIISESVDALVDWLLLGIKESMSRHNSFRIPELES